MFTSLRALAAHSGKSPSKFLKPFAGIVAAAAILAPSDAAAQDYSVEASPMPVLANGGRMFLIDVNNDGLPDVLSQNTTTANEGIQLRLNQGGGSFGAPISANNTTGTFESGPMNGVSFRAILANSNPSLFKVDVDNDGYVDLVEFNNSPTPNRWIRNKGGNNGWEVLASPFPSLAFAPRVFFADFNKDGAIDVLYQTGNTAGTGIVLALNNGSGQFTTTHSATDGTGTFTSGPLNGLSFTHISAGGYTQYYFDYDHDGDKDIVEQVNNAAGRVILNGAGTAWTPSTTALPNLQFSNRMIFADLNSDGKIDAFYQNGNTNNQGFAVMMANGSGYSPAVSASNAGLFSAGPFNGITFTDLTAVLFHSIDIEGDGDLDIIEMANGVAGRLLRQNSNPPVLVSTIPADNATGVSVNTTLSFTFDRSVSKGTGNIVIRRSSDDLLIESIPVSGPLVTGSGTTWVADPSVTLVNYTGYYVTVDAGTFVDASARAFPGFSNKLVYNFVTINPPPTDILLSNATLAENSPANSSVGALSAVDSSGDTHTYALVPGTGDTDNAAFNIFGGTVLRFTGIADFETKSSYSVRVRVTDSSNGQFEKAFLITITNVDEAPTIAAISAQSTLEDTTSDPIAVTVADPEGDAITVTATSSNQAIVADSSIVVGGSGNNRTLTITPVANAFGAVTITVKAASTTFETTTTFTFTVTAVNDAPTLAAISPVSIPVNAGLQTVNLSGISAGVGETQTLTVTAASDNPTLIPTPVVTYTSPSATGSLSFTPAANQAGTATITVTVTDNGGTANGGIDTTQRTFVVTVAPQANLSITKTDGVTTVNAGGSVTYTIVASNPGPNSVTGATVEDILPASLTGTWTAVGAGGGSIANPAGSGNINELVDLPVGGSVTFTVSATVSPSATGTLVNTATIALPSGISDPMLSNNSATDTDTIVTSADLAITKTNGSASVTAGASVTYTIVASNAGPSNIIGATVADTLPGSITNVTWSTSASGGATASPSGVGNIADTVNLPVGGSVTYTVTGTVSPAATGTLVNTATITAPAGATDPNPGNNSATDTDTINASADLAITVTDGVSSAVPGGTVTYTIVASNAGPSNVPSATVADTFPASLSNISWTVASAGGATAAASTGSGNINQAVTLPSGSSLTYTVTATVSASATGSLANTATISSAISDPNTANNSATDTDTLTPQADVSVVITDSPDPVDAGSNLTYTVTVTNAGPSNASTATLNATFPTGFSIVSSTAAPDWTGTLPLPGTSGPLSMSRPNFPPGTSVFTIIGTVPYLPNNTVLSATALVGSATDDPSSGNNTSSATTTVRAIPEIAVFDGATELTDGQAGVINFGSTTFGNPINRTFTISNPGTGALVVSGITVPSGFSLGAATVFPISIPPTQTANFTVTYNAPSIGTQTGSIVIASNDDNEGSFDFPVSGTRTNIAPVATGGSVTTDEDEALDITLAATDGDSDPLTYGIVLPPANGTAILVGNLVTYTPNPNFNGSDSFTFTVTDGVANSNMATVNITIDAVNDTPVVVGTGIADVTQIRPGLSTTIDLADFFDDVETASDALTYTVTPASGTPFYTLVRNGTELTITGDSPGTVVITVTAEDPEEASVSDVFTLLVKHVPSMPNGGIPNTLVSPSAASHEIDLGNYFIDGDGDDLTFSLNGNTDPTKVTVTITGATLSIVPDAPGVTELTIRVTDEDGNFIEDVVEVTVDDPVPTLTEGGIAPAPRLNVQTGLYEVPIVATNSNQFDVPGFRIRVTSALPAGFRLQNATSPAGEAQPYLDVLTRLAPGESIVVVMEFFSVSRNFDGFSPTLVAEPLPTGIQNDATGTGTQVTRFVRLPDGSMLMEFATIPGHTYQIEYTDDLTTWKRCLVPIGAAANYTQWIDRGAPYTESHPSTSSSRFYRVSDITLQN